MCENKKFDKFINKDRIALLRKTHQLVTNGQISKILNVNAVEGGLLFGI
jgi:hypothetical protein